MACSVQHTNALLNDQYIGPYLVEGRHIKYNMCLIYDVDLFKIPFICDTRCAVC